MGRAPVHHLNGLYAHLNFIVPKPLNMNYWTESLGGMVFPVQCDHKNHESNRWYAHFFDEAMFAF